MVKKQTGNKAETKLPKLLKIKGWPKKQSGNKPENKAGHVVENNGLAKNKPETKRKQTGNESSLEPSLPQRVFDSLTSQNFDGEYIARIIEKHGYGASRGSSSRGAGRSLVEMARCLRSGRDTAFTIDGPRGPKFVAKRGSVILSRSTGAAILCFHVALKNAYVFSKSWDQTQVPHPFSQAAVFIAPPIVVPEGATEEEQNRKQEEVQRTLDELRQRGERWAAAG